MKREELIKIVQSNTEANWQTVNIIEAIESYKQDIRAEVIDEFCEGYKNFQTDENICDLQEDCSFSGGWCIDCFKDKWLKEQK